MRCGQRGREDSPIGREFVRSAGAIVPLWNPSNPARSSAPEPTISWTFNTGEAANITEVVGGMLYARTNSAVHALSVYVNEQWRYRAGSERTSEDDVYDLGLLAAELLTGHGRVEAIERIESRDATLGDVLRRATTSDPDDRHESALKFADTLRWAGRSDP